MSSVQNIITSGFSGALGGGIVSSIISSSISNTINRRIEQILADLITPIIIYPCGVVYKVRTIKSSKVATRSFTKFIDALYYALGELPIIDGGHRGRIIIRTLRADIDEQIILPDNTYADIDFMDSAVYTELTEDPLIQIGKVESSRVPWTYYRIRNLNIIKKSVDLFTAIDIGRYTSGVVLENIKIVNGYGMDRTATPSPPPDDSTGIHIDLAGNEDLILRNIKIVNFDKGIVVSKGSHLYIDDMLLMYTNTVGIEVRPTFTVLNNIHLFRVGGTGVAVLGPGGNTLGYQSSQVVINNLLFEGTRPQGYNDNITMIDLKGVQATIINMMCQSTAYDDINVLDVNVIGYGESIVNAYDGMFSMLRLDVSVTLDDTGEKITDVVFPYKYHPKIAEYLTGIAFPSDNASISEIDAVDKIWLTDITNESCKLHLLISTAIGGTIPITILIFPAFKPS